MLRAEVGTLRSRRADKDELLTARAARHGWQTRPVAGEVGPAGACEAILRQGPPATRNGILLLAPRSVLEPVTLELLNQLRDELP